MHLPTQSSSGASRPAFSLLVSIFALALFATAKAGINTESPTVQNTRTAGPRAGQTPPAEGNILCVSYTDTNTGTAVGQSGTILRTTDGGATWTVQLSGTMNALSDVLFTDANRGMAVGANGTILRTTNGGATWTIPSCETRKTLNAAQDDPIQLWISRYNGTANGADDVVGMAASPDGSRVFVTGSSPGLGTADDWATVAYDASTGNQKWVTRFNGPANRYDDPQAAPVVSPDGSRIYVTGSTGVGGTGVGMRTAAYDAGDGRELWAAPYQGPANMSDSPAALALSPDGSRLFVTGWSQYPSPVFDNYVTIAYDAHDGSQLWVSDYNGPSSDDALAVAVNAGGSRVFVTGTSGGVGTHVDFATVAYDAADGHQLWVSRYNGPANFQDQGQAVGVSADGSRVFVTGESASGGSTTSFFDYATVAYDTNDGSQLWVGRYNGPANSGDWARQLAVAGNRVFATGGSPGMAQPLQDFATVAYDTTNGHQLWVARYQGLDDQSSWFSITRAIGVSPDGTRVFVTGPSPGIGTKLDYVTAAYCISDGGQLWIARYDGEQGSDTASGLAVRGSRVYVAGSRGAVAAVNNDYATVAYQDQGPIPTSAVSRKTHVGAGNFDIALPLTDAVGVECRLGGGATFDSHQVVVTFSNAVTLSAVTVSSPDGGSATAGYSVTGNQVTLNLSTVVDQHTVVLTLNDVNEGTGTGDVVIPMAVLRGDTTADRLVNSADATQTKNRAGQATNATNFRSDVNTDGAVNSGDTNIVRDAAGGFVP